MAKDKILNIDDNYENLFVRIHKEKKAELRKIAKEKGKTISVILRELIEKLIEQK